uniref:cytochrome c oxidase subunit II n=1 Tax=Tapes dorsatus TaxID=368939 RepID=UPI00203692C2|nr:cytochrome c oxidase subunit II [Tapes dorsatus]URH16439.1 cytochrome c oxidase subunit II [Tapes dorsatus]
MGWNQFGFPDPVTLNAGRLFSYHDLVMVVVVFVLIVVAWFTSMALFSFLFMKGQLNLSKKKDEWLEIFWTVSPAFFLFGIGFVSLVNLYHMNLGGEPVYSFSAIGHQWYWEYTYELGRNEEVSTFEQLAESACKECPSFIEKYRDVKSKDIDEMISELSMKYGCEFVSFKVLSWLEDMIKKEKQTLLESLTYAYKNSSCVTGPATESCASRWVEVFGMGSDESLDKVVMQATLFQEAINKNNKSFTDQYKMSTDYLSNVLHSLLDLNGKSLRYDSYMVEEGDLTDESKSFFGGFRRGQVTNPCFLCCGVKTEVLVSTVDVMHSWGVPELGIKIDAIPGRINSGSVVPKVPGFYYGFCYELCGTGHSEMPITAVVLDKKNYLESLEQM